MFKELKTSFRSSAESHGIASRKIEDTSVLEMSNSKWPAADTFQQVVTQINDHSKLTKVDSSIGKKLRNPIKSISRPNTVLMSGC